MLLYFNLLLCLYMLVKVFEERKYFQYSFLELQFKFHTTMAFNSVGILPRGIQRINYEDNTCYIIYFMNINTYSPDLKHMVIGRPY